MNNSSLPSSMVTLLFTDIEGSTRLAQQYPEAMPVLLARHDEILNQSFAGYLTHPSVLWNFKHEFRQSTPVVPI